MIDHISESLSDVAADELKPNMQNDGQDEEIKNDPNQNQVHDDIFNKPIDWWVVNYLSAKKVNQFGSLIDELWK